jgi:hypothetical protein
MLHLRRRQHDEDATMRIIAAFFIGLAIFTAGAVRADPSCTVGRSG